MNAQFVKWSMEYFRRGGDPGRHIAGTSPPILGLLGFPTPDEIPHAYVNWLILI